MRHVETYQLVRVSCGANEPDDLSGGGDPDPTAGFAPVVGWLHRAAHAPNTIYIKLTFLVPAGVEVDSRSTTDGVLEEEGSAGSSSWRETSITCTPEHLLFAAKCLADEGYYDHHHQHDQSVDVTPRPIKPTSTFFARDMQVGDQLFFAQDTSFMATPILHKEVFVSSELGIYAPLTSVGTVVVGGAFCSCYANLPSHELCDLLTWPLR